MDARRRPLVLVALVALVVIAGAAFVIADDDEHASVDGASRTSVERTEPTRATDGPSAVSVDRHGAVGDGSSDDTAAFRAAIEAASDGAGLLEVPVGTYLLSGPLELPPSLEEVRLAADAVLRQTVDAPVFVRRGAVTAGPLPTTGATEDATAVSVAADAVVPGDWLVIASTEAVHLSKNLMLGSLRRATGVEGRSVTLDRPLHRDLTEGTTGWKIDLAPPVSIRGGVIEHADPRSVFQPLVLFEWVESPVLDDVEIRSCGGSGVKAVGTRGGELSVFVHDCVDDHSGARFGKGRHYGYGIEVAGPTRDLVVTGRAHSVRHAFTTGSSYPNVDERLENVGEPENIDVSMEVWDTTSSGLDTHELGIDVRFHDCTVRDAGRYAREGSTDGREGGFGIFIRSPETTVERCTITGSAVSGIVVADAAEGIDAWSTDRAARIVDTVISETEGRSAVQLKQPAMLQGVEITGSHVFGIEFSRDGETSTVTRSTIELDGPEKSFAFVNPGGATLEDNVLRTDEEQLG